MRGKRTRPSDDVWDGHGGYMGMKKAKLVNQFSDQAKEEEKKAGIFLGVSIFVNGWTKPSSDELKRIMMNHGGVYHHYYNSRKTTHIIASNLPDVKIRQLKGHELIIKPEWILSCLSEGRLVDYKPFLLFTHQTKLQGTIKFEASDKPLLEAGSRLQSPNKSTASEESTYEKVFLKLDDLQQNIPLRADGNTDILETGVEKDNHKSTIHISPAKAKDASDPRFLGEFFQNSRLHHISTMGANAKEYVSKLREQHNGTFPARAGLKYISNKVEVQGKTIMHIDMDCFFVSVGLRKHPDLIGKPVAVAHARGNKTSRGAEEDKLATERRKAELSRYEERLAKRSGPAPVDTAQGTSKGALADNIDGLSSFSEIASCSYEAREKGVRNGMFLGPALKLCPELKTIPYDFPGYEEVSRIMYDTVASYTLDIQAVSCDEMFVDLTSLLAELQMNALDFVTHLRHEIKSKTNCKCSVGLARNIFLARMSTKQAKPDGQFLLEDAGVLDLLAGLKVADLPGVGRSLERRLKSINIETCGDIQKLSLGQLQSELGNKSGAQLFNFCRGIDERKLELDQVRKTVSAEVNYGIRFTGWEDANKFVQQLSGEVSERLDRLGRRGRSITLKLMVRAENAPSQTAKFLGHGVCDSTSRSVQLPSPTNDKDKIFKEVFGMLRQLEVVPSDIRGVGISVSKLEEKKGIPRNSVLKFVKVGEEASAPAHLAALPTAGSSSDHTACKLDPEVLAALPEHIRREVLTEYNLVNPRAGESSVQPLTDLNQPGPSHRREEVAGQASVGRGASETISVWDLSFSQVDKEMLQELPVHLAQEILTHFRSVASKQNKEWAERDILEPSKKTSPRKKSPSKKRGRPPKSSSTLRTVKSNLNNLPKSNSTDVICVRRSPAKPDVYDENSSLDQFPGEDESSRDSLPAAEEEVPTFCGKSSLEDIRPLIKEWLRSTANPLDEDMLLMAGFLEGLVSTRKIHLVSILFTCIYRNILALEKPENWKASFIKLVATVQRRMVQCYGKPLLVKHTF